MCEDVPLEWMVFDAFKPSETGRKSRKMKLPSSSDPSQHMHILTFHLAFYLALCLAFDLGIWYGI
jgi:hypothetical protein